MSQRNETQEQARAFHQSIMLDDQILEFVPGAVYVCDLEGVVVRYNRRAGELWGRSPCPGDPQERFCGSHRLYLPSGEPLPHDQTPMVDALREGTSYRNLEVQVEQPNGHRIWILASIDPLRNDAGEIVGVINCFQDISDRKQADEKQRVLINELNHRVKNTLATVQALATYTFRKGSGDDALTRFEGRLMALSRAHNVLTDESWSGANLRNIAGDTVESIAGQGDDRLRLQGADLYLKPQLALSIATVLHELSTNALKYGALSSPEGRVSLSWTIEKESSGQVLKITWEESAGPVVSPPLKKGFGTRVIERSLSQEHQAKVKLEFPFTGARCEMEIPIIEVV